MKVLIQIVKEASVTVDEVTIGKIGTGVLYFVAFKNGDTSELVDKMLFKILKLRIFPDQNGKTNLSLDKVNGSILSISQFTLYANMKEGNRPSFTSSMAGKESEILYNYFNKCLNELGYHVQTGKFGADMKVSLVNDGPFTVMIDSEELYG